MSEQTPLVGVLMGSQSDWPVMQSAVTTLESLAIPCEARVISAHRRPERLTDYVGTAKERGIRVLIAGAGMAAISLVLARLVPRDPEPGNETIWTARIPATAPIAAAE